MATRKTSQPHNEPTPNPFTALPGADVWRSMMEAQAERFEKMLGEMERLERERHVRAVTAIDDMTQLIKSSIDYQRELTAEWRKMSLDAAKKSAEMMGAISG